MTSARAQWTRRGLVCAAWTAALATACGGLVNDATGDAGRTGRGDSGADAAMKDSSGPDATSPSKPCPLRMPTVPWPEVEDYPFRDGYPRAVGLTAGDFDGDGRVDFIVALDGGRHAMSFLQGRGDGTFVAPYTFGAGKVPAAITSGDLDGDGDLDLVLADARGDDVLVFLGDGGGIFGASTPFATGKQPVGVAAADLDGDGVLDLAVASSGSADVSVLLGRGDGTYRSAVSYATGKPVSRQPLTIGDFDGDGVPDIAVSVTSGQGGAAMLLGKGDGTFAPGPGYRAVVGAIASGDLDGDGNLDSALARAGTVTVLLGNGFGGFFGTGPFKNPASYTAKGDAIAVRDLDGDGTLDLVLDGVSVLLGNGNGTFQPAHDFAAGGSPSGVAIEDCDGDGKLDVVVANETGSDLGVFLGHGDGSLAATQHVGVGLTPVAIATADFDRDGWLDLAIVDQKAEDVTVLRHASGHRFERLGTVGTGRSPVALAAVDLDGDSNPDLVVANHVDRTVSVLLGKGDGTFQGAGSYPASPRPTSVATGDLDGDGALDLVVGNGCEGKECLLMGPELTVFLGNGDGTFGLGAGFGPASHISTVATGDLDGDGNLDVAVSRACLSRDCGTPGASLDVFFGHGDGSLAAPVHQYGVYYSTALTIVDLDGDGILDVAMAGDGVAAALTGKGDGTFDEWDYACNAPIAITTGDFDGDGRIDLATANAHDTASIFLGRANGLFRPALSYGAGRGPSGVVAGDFDGDGRLDLAISDSASHRVSVMFNGACPP